MTLSRRADMIPAIRDIAERVAQCAGYESAEAVRIASSVRHAVDVVFARPEPPDQPEPPDIDIRFVRDGGHLEVWLRYPAWDGDNRGEPLDPVLSREALRQGIDSVEFGREGDMAYCRLRRALPKEKVDHECEAPPD